MARVSRLLVANRGEIARRIFRTCRPMGIGTVAVYSDPDEGAPFVDEADEAFALGGSTPAESYLRIDRLLEAARATRADAVHPGYGFLAENADFARAVEREGLVWIGPPASAIEKMGSKLESKRIMTDAGVPTLTAIDLTGMDKREIADAGERCGYPALVKASAGGGGKGMRIVAASDGLVAAVTGARREAASAFGDDTVFLERYVPAPRHVEIQVFGDTHGNVVSLFERECSIQRRHQKIIEEAPSPAVSAGLRTRMGRAAVAAAQAVGYVGAGTVEFLLEDNDFSFLEMNTRLQVEHPVTEAITGLDLVRLQILVAEGEPLPPEALEPRMTGHAIEARLYAEDPTNDFLPATGTLDRIRFPVADGLRVDSGVEDGSVISADYDPMLAKAIAWAPTRSEAAGILARALERAEIHGSKTNRDLLARILRDDEFLAGGTDTHYLERNDPAVLGRSPTSTADIQRSALAAALAAQAGRADSRPVLGSIPAGWRNNPAGLESVGFGGPDGDIQVGYRITGRSGLEAEIDGVAIEAAVTRMETSEVVLTVDDVRRRFRVNRVGAVHHVDGPSGYVRLVEHPRFPTTLREYEAGSLRAPMPGKITEVAVEVGSRVEAGTVLLVMEAMKMEHTLRTPTAGTVSEIRAKAGDQVEADQVLVVVDEG